MQDSVFGTYLHGLFDTGELTEKLTEMCIRDRGEGTGAVASIPLWDMALAVYGGCYSFAAVSYTHLFL